MSFTIELTDEAREDVTIAVKWYDGQKEGLGDLFIEYLDNSLEKIRNYPTAYKKIYRQVRQSAMQKFPYVILFKIVDEVITVHCIFHTSLNPKKKIKRLKK
jgi:uncharacterized protein Yka (UPF0111/DUF47 family)